MPMPSGSPDLPAGLRSVRVPMRGMSGRLAALVAVGALGVVVALGLAGPGGDEPPRSQAELASSTAAPTTTPTRETAPATSDTSVSKPRCAEIAPTAGTPLPDVAGALPGDDGRGPLPLGTVNTAPNEDRLDFLVNGFGCFRDANWIDPRNADMGSGGWTAGRPFHVREGFINNAAQPLGEGFNIVLYVTQLVDGREEPTYRYTSDSVLRGTTDRCGPTYRVQAGPETCEWFVHDFPDGLPEGRFAIWAVWEAPCEAWVDLGLADSCAEPDRVISIFASGFDGPHDVTEPSYSETAGD